MRETAIAKRNRALENFWYVYRLYIFGDVDLYGGKRYLGIDQLDTQCRLVAIYEAHIQES